MGRRFAAFLATATGGVVELFGAIYGQGIIGQGALFGLAGPATRTEATMIAFVLGTATIVCAVAIMFRRDARVLASLAAVAAVVGTLAAGPIYGVGAALALIGSSLAARIDRSAPLV